MSIRHALMTIILVAIVSSSKSDSRPLEDTTAIASYDSTYYNNIYIQIDTQRKENQIKLEKIKESINNIDYEENTKLDKK